MKKKSDKKTSSLEASPTVDSALFAQFTAFSTRKGDIARTKILSATLQCIAHQGIEKTGFESIGKLCGMRRAHVAYYYPDRDELVLAAIQFAIATAQQTTVAHVFQAPSDKERLDAFVHGIFDWAEKYPEHTRVILLFYYCCSCEPKYKALHHQVREQGAQRIAAVLKPLLPSTPSREVVEYAKLLQNLITGSLVDHITTQPKATLSSLAERVSRQCHAIVGISVP